MRAITVSIDDEPNDELPRRCPSASTDDEQDRHQAESPRLQTPRSRFPVAAHDDQRPFLAVNGIDRASAPVVNVGPAMIHLDHPSKPSLLSWTSLSDHPTTLDPFLSFQPDLPITAIADPMTTVGTPANAISSTMATNPHIFTSVADDPTGAADNSTLAFLTIPPSSPNPVDASAERSSSLSPVPESGSPPAPIATSVSASAAPDPAPDPSLYHPPRPPLAQEEEEQQPQVIQKEEEEDALPDPPSNQSTPLSELSPDPDHDISDALNTEHQSTSASTSPVPGLMPAQQAGPPQSMSDPPASNNVTADSLTNTSFPAASDPPHDSISAQRPSQRNLDSSAATHSPIARTSWSTEPATSISPPLLPKFTTTQPTSAGDSKVVTILKLNAELLKISMEFQARGIAMSEPKLQQISNCLQSNLAWLAAAADQSRQVSHSNMPLPVMECPTIDSVPMDRIQKLYADLPTIFSKEINRRLQYGMSVNASVANVPQSLKRDRSDENLGIMDPVNKRRDTGETKALSSSMPPPAILSPAAAAGQNNYPPPIPNGNASTAMQPPPPPPPSLPTLPNSNPSVSMPRLAGGLQLNTAEAQAAASSRDRARRMQIQQAFQQQQLHPPNSRQMSPPSGPSGAASGHQQQVSPSQIPPLTGQAHQNPLPGSITRPGSSMNSGARPNPNPALAALGPNAAQNFSLLQQNPSHPFLNYMNQVVSNFSSLSVQEQLQKMQYVQNMLRQQQLQNPPQPRPGAGGGAGMLNLGMAGMHSGLSGSTGMPSAGNNSGAQFPFHTSTGGSGPSRSPAHQQSPVMPGQQLSQQQQAAGSLAGPQAMMQAGMGMVGLTTQQRQQLFIHHQQQQHQQQMLRAAGMGVGQGGGMMGPQQAFGVAQERLRQDQQQRMVQGSPTGHGVGTQMALEGEDGFVGLHSAGISGRRSAIPGIARSTRSPSESGQSPIAPRAQGRASSIGLGVGVGRSGTPEEYQRLMHVQQQQAQALAFRGMSGHSPASFGGQIPLPGSMPGISSTATGAPPNWRQQQQQQQQGMHMGVGNAGGQSASFGMSAGTNLGVGPGPFTGSPPPGSNQGWQGHYAFSPSGTGGMGLGDQVHGPGNLSETPASQQQQSQSLQNRSPSMDAADFDIFSWSQQ